jgi:transcriptional regulator with XRE-family HTH domain
MATIGGEVKRLREGKGLTQAQLAVRSHLGMSFVWSVEMGREVDWCSWHVERLAMALEVPEGSLLSLIPIERLGIRPPDAAA